MHFKVLPPARRQQQLKRAGVPSFLLPPVVCATLLVAAAGAPEARFSESSHVSFVQRRGARKEKTEQKNKSARLQLSPLLFLHLEVSLRLKFVLFFAGGSFMNKSACFCSKVDVRGGEKNKKTQKWILVALKGRKKNTFAFYRTASRDASSFLYSRRLISLCRRA